MSVNTQYLQAVIHYLSVLGEEAPEKTRLNGKDAYVFSCPFCSQYVHTDQAKQSKTGRLVKVKDNTWVFSCRRGFSKECRGGSRSFHNFLAFLHPGLLEDYQVSLGMLDKRNHKAIRRFKEEQ